MFWKDKTTVEVESSERAVVAGRDVNGLTPDQSYQLIIRLLEERRDALDALEKERELRREAEISLVRLEVRIEALSNSGGAFE